MTKRVYRSTGAVFADCRVAGEHGDVNLEIPGYGMKAYPTRVLVFSLKEVLLLVSWRLELMLASIGKVISQQNGNQAVEKVEIGEESRADLHGYMARRCE